MTMGITDLTLRPCGPDDAPELYRWRNHPTTRAASVSTEVLSYDHHLLWLERHLADTTRFMWIGCLENRAVGSLRLDRVGSGGGDYLVSIQTDPEQRGRGLGQRMLDAGCREARNVLQASRLIAHIRPENQGSRTIFVRAGFELQPGATDAGLEIWHLEFTTPAGL